MYIIYFLLFFFFFIRNKYIHSLNGKYKKDEQFFQYVQLQIQKTNTYIAPQKLKHSAQKSRKGNVHTQYKLHTLRRKTASNKGNFR